jgi:hypothetical protein
MGTMATGLGLGLTSFVRRPRCRTRVQCSCLNALHLVLAMGTGRTTWIDAPHCVPCFMSHQDGRWKRKSEVKISEEPNRAKPPDEGRFVPEGEPPRTKIAPLGQSPVAPGAHLFAQSGYFSSVPFSRSKRVLSVFFGNPGAVRQNTGISPRFATVGLF